MNNGIRCHFSSIITNTLKSVWVLILFVILNFAQNADNISAEDITIQSTRIVAYILLAIILVVALFYFLRWRKTYIYITDENLIIDKNFLFQKKKTTVKLKSIATVNFQQGILERIFNTYRLQIDINSSVTAEKTDFNLVFSKLIAEDIKRKLTSNISENPDNTSIIQTEKEPYQNVLKDDYKSIFEFTPGRVIKHGFLSISVGGFLFSLITLIFILYLDLSENTSGGSTLSTIIAVLLVVGPIIIQCVSPFLRYMNFKIGKQKDRVVISYGFITKRQFNVPLEKINAVVIKQPILARLCHLYYGELISVGMGDEENQQAPIFCLMVNRQELDIILKEINPKFIVTDFGESSPKSAIVSVYTPYLIWGILAVVVSSIFNYWWVGTLILLFLIACAFASYKTKALSIQDDKTIITTGIFLKRSIIVPFSKIQNIDFKNGPISRHFGLSKGSANILASLVNQTNNIGYFPTDRFETISKKILEFDSVSK